MYIYIYMLFSWYFHDLPLTSFNAAHALIGLALVAVNWRNQSYERYSFGALRHRCGKNFCDFCGSLRTEKYRLVSGNLLHSYWKWHIEIVDLYRTVSLPEGNDGEWEVLMNLTSLIFGLKIIWWSGASEKSDLGIFRTETKDSNPSGGCDKAPVGWWFTGIILHWHILFYWSIWRFPLIRVQTPHHHKSSI